MGLYSDAGDLIIVLSARWWILYLLAPLCLYKKIAFVYHFVPNLKQALHRRSMYVLKHLYTVIVYSKPLVDLLDIKWGVKSVYLPSRCIDRQRAVDLLENKLKKGSNQLLVPGVRDGVRNIKDLDSILERVEQNVSLDVKNVVIQIDNVRSSHMTKLEVKFVSKMDAESYKNMFEKSICVYINFDESYELRASGVLLDAIAAGCIIFSTEHPITNQYGYPHSLVTDVESFNNLTYPLNINRMLELTGVMDFNNSKLEWIKFINGKIFI